MEYIAEVVSNILGAIMLCVAAALLLSKISWIDEMSRSIGAGEMPVYTAGRNIGIYGDRN